MREDETHYAVLRLFDANPEISQRDISRKLGVSLGKVNYCIKSLVRQGCVRVSNFKNSRNKMAYMYLLTPRGIEQKGKLTLRFLQRKMREYDALRAEIRVLRQETGARK